MVFEARELCRTHPHDKLMARVRERVADGRVLKLIESFLKANIMEGLERWTPAAGAPQGRSCRRC